MSEEFYNDGNYIFINTEAAEAYISDELFDKTDEDPTASSLAYITGEGVHTLGLFYMRFFNTDNITQELRDRTRVRTLNYPNLITTVPSGEITKKELTINGQTDVYRVLRYSKGDILMDATSKKSASNVELLTKLILRGKVPKSLAYEDIYFVWKKNFEINGFNPRSPMALIQAMVARMCRNPANLREEFRIIAGKGNANPHDYAMLGLNQVAANSSVMVALSYERFFEKLTSSLIMTQEGTPQENSPIEKVLTL